MAVVAYHCSKHSVTGRRPDRGTLEIVALLNGRSALQFEFPETTARTDLNGQRDLAQATRPIQPPLSSVMADVAAEDSSDPGMGEDMATTMGRLHWYQNAPYS